MIYTRNKDSSSGTEKKQNKESRNIVENLIKRLQSKKLSKEHIVQNQQLKYQINHKQKNSQANQNKNYDTNGSSTPFSKIKQSAFYGLVANKNKSTNSYNNGTSFNHLNSKQQEQLDKNANQPKQSRTKKQNNQKQANFTTQSYQNININSSPINLLNQSNSQSHSKQFQRQNNRQIYLQLQPCFDIKVQSERPLNQSQRRAQQMSYTDIYFKFYQKGRNILITNSMQLMQLKNQINLDLYKILQKQDPKASYQGRIRSINKCLAKNQEIIQVYQRLLKSCNTNDKTKTIYTQKYSSIKELQQLCDYQARAIEKYRKDMQQQSVDLNLSSKPVNNHSYSYSYSQKNKQKVYSYINQIGLLRHQINRLFNQNTQIYDILSKFINQQENSQLKSHNQSKVKYWNEHQPTFQNQIMNQKNQAINFHQNQHDITFSQQKYEKVERLQIHGNQYNQELQKSYRQVIVKQFKDSLRLRQFGQNNYNDRNQDYYDRPHSPRKSKKQQTYEIKGSINTQFNQNQNQKEQTHNEDLFQTNDLKQEVYKVRIQKQFLQTQLQMKLAQILSLQRKNQKLAEEIESLRSVNETTNSFYEDKLLKLQQENNFLMEKNTKIYNANTNSFDPNTPQKQIHESVYSSKMNLEELFKFLKPYKQYYMTLLNVVQAYQKKIAFLHQQASKQKVNKGRLISFIDEIHNLLETVQKYLNGLSKAPLIQTCKNPNILLAEISSKKNDYQLLIDDMNQQSMNHSKLQYYLMLIKSITIGINRNDVQTIQQELFDYIKNLQSRLPTVIQMDDEQSINRSIRSQFE